LGKAKASTRDLHDGSAYVAVTPLWIGGARFRRAPPLPFLYKFCELNVRTYVRYKGIPEVNEAMCVGIFFFAD